MGQLRRHSPKRVLGPGAGPLAGIEYQETHRVVVVEDGPQAPPRDHPPPPLVVLQDEYAFVVGAVETTVADVVEYVHVFPSQRTLQFAERGPLQNPQLSATVGDDAGKGLPQARPSSAAASNVGKSEGAEMRSRIRSGGSTSSGRTETGNSGYRTIGRRSESTKKSPSPSL